MEGKIIVPNPDFVPKNDYTVGMEIIIGHKSALEYWRLYGSAKIDDTARLRRKSAPLRLPNITDIRDMMPSGLSYPISFIVGSKNAKRESALVRSRAYTGPTPDGCFISIGDRVSVSSPSFCFFQMAGELPLLKLIELGYELCGTYSLSINSEYSPELEVTDKTIYGHPRLTDTRALNAFVTRMKGISGHEKTCRALRYIADGSASPMETILVMLLTLPYKLGGYGLPMPELNKRIDLKKAIKQNVGKAYYICDIFWPDANLVIEYDSDFYHTGADRIASDSKKRLDLAAQGITVVTVTWKQIRNIAEFDILAKLIAGKLHRRLRYMNPQFSKAQRELRNTLF